ncbi:MAG TPA: hypothetical protein VN914_05235 [Polyangia bacterium]|nr:hypothetical protein [Polyangia bacterium]
MRLLGAVLLALVAACGSTQPMNRASGGTGGSSGGGGAAGGSSGTGGSPVVDAAPGASMSACPALVLSANRRVADYDTDQIVWQDSACKPRQVALVRVGGGYVRQYVYEVDGKPRTVTGTGANGHTGWGYTVNHWGNTATVGRDAAGTFQPLYVGRHHALYQYAFTIPINGRQIPVTQHWFFATGRDHPVLATSYDLTGVPPGSLGADTRTPYGDLAWDGDDNARSTIVDGVAWGDRYKFTTTRAPLTMNSPWDYSKPNLVPYVLAWTVKSDAEMGIVQTQTQAQHDGGGYWFYDNWGKTSESAAPRKQGQIGLMTPTWNWTYQINQYELCIENPACLESTTSSHRLAWGANYGAVGGAKPGSGEYPAYGDDRMLSGHPYQSYSIFMVLGKHSAAPVFGQVTEVEEVQGTHLAASAGTVATMGPGGVGRTDLVPLAPAGYDHRYAVFRVEAAANRVALKLTVDRGALDNPVLLVSGYTAAAPPSVKIDGAARVADADVLVSLDSAAKQVWITLRGGFGGSHDLEIQ